MALSEEARAKRYEWRAGVLACDPGNHRKQQDAAVFTVAARLAREVADLRPAFQAKADEYEASQAEAIAKWVRGGRRGDKPTNQEAMSGDPDVVAFRAARDSLTAYLNRDDVAAAVARCAVNDWTEPTDEELLAS